MLVFGGGHRKSLPGTVSPVTPLEDAQTFVLAQCPPLPTVEVGFSEAIGTGSIGMVLASDVVADELVPPFNNTAVDGYALVADSVATAERSASRTASRW